MQTESEFRSPFQMFNDCLRIFSLHKLNLSFTETDAETQIPCVVGVCITKLIDRQFGMFLYKYSPLMQDLSFKRYLKKNCTRNFTKDFKYSLTLNLQT